MNQKKWIIKETNSEKARALKEQLGQTGELFCALLVSRGLDTYEKVKSFFTPSLSQLYSPWTMKDMDRAVRRLLEAIQKEEKILLYGDYDVDGTAATAMMLRFLRSHYSDQLVDYYIPDRYTEGYGVSRGGIEYAISSGVNLVISLDCGITANEVIIDAVEDGIDFIICDHHLPGAEMPKATAILNPKQTDCPYPFKELCGCGVAFKFITAVAETICPDGDEHLQYLDLVALATGADVVPIVDENRILVHYGLKQLNENPCMGISALKATNPHISKYTLSHVIFGLAPKINAAGRMHHARIAVELFATGDDEIAKSHAMKLAMFNDHRKEQDESITREALAILRERESFVNMKSTVIYREEWHPGVLGIVASRLIERHYKPTIVLTMGKDYVSGSARSISGFNIHDAIRDCSEYLVRFGGHFAAAGLTLRHENVEPFTKKFEEIVSRTLLPEFSLPQLNIDLEIGLGDIDYRFFNTINRMEPFGQQNPEPVFITRNVRLSEYSRIVGENHVRFVIHSEKDKVHTGIGFNLKDKFEALNAVDTIDIVYSIKENVWNNQKSLQLRIIDFAPSVQPS